MRSDTSHVLGKLQGDDAQYMYSPKSLALVYMRNMCSLRVPEEAPQDGASLAAGICTSRHGLKLRLNIGRASGCTSACVPGGLGGKPQGEHQQTHIGRYTQGRQYRHDVATCAELFPVQAIFAHLGEELLIAWRVVSVCTCAGRSGCHRPCWRRNRLMNKMPAP